MSAQVTRSSAGFLMLDRGLQAIIGAMLLLMVGLNVVNAAGRYLFGQSLAGADEILVFSMVWLVFLGVPLIAARREHLGFSWLVQSLPERASLFLQFLLDFYLCVLCLWLALQSWHFVERISMIGQKSMSAGIPMVIPHSAITLAMVATALVCGWRGVESVIRASRTPSAKQT